jgi:AcrR family transcriptional regulator
MVPRTDEQYEEIRLKRKQQIAGVALELFATDAYQNTSVSKIAAKAGISKGLMYNYFKNKESLLHYILIEGLKDKLDVFIQLFKNMDSREKFRAMVEMIFGMIRKDPHYWKLYFSLAIQPIVLESLQNILQEIGMEFLKLIQEYFIKKGSSDPAAEAWVLTAAFDGAFMDYLVMPETYPLERVIDMIVEKFA